MLPQFIRSHPKDWSPYPTVGFEPAMFRSSDLYTAALTMHCSISMGDFCIKRNEEGRSKSLVSLVISVSQASVTDDEIHKSFKM
jgi:hypothetical protein